MDPVTDLRIPRRNAVACGMAAWVKRRRARIAPLLRPAYGTRARDMAEALAHAAWSEVLNREIARVLRIVGDVRQAAENEEAANECRTWIYVELARLQGRTRRRVARLLSGVTIE